jgi:zinc transporter ZupT
VGVLDDHNRQHTYGNSLGPPTSVAGVSAQQAVDAHKRLVDGSAPVSSGAGGEMPWRSALWFAVGCGVIAIVLAVAAYAVGGIGAFALGLLAVVAGFIGMVFVVIALVQGAKAGFAANRNRPRA